MLPGFAVVLVDFCVETDFVAEPVPVLPVEAPPGFLVVCPVLAAVLTFFVTFLGLPTVRVFLDLVDD